MTMSNLLRANGDDYPVAARRHATDATALIDNTSYHGAAYLAGYVVECSVKTLIQVEGGVTEGHDFSTLSSRASLLCAMASAKAAKYLTADIRALAGPPAGKPPIAGWRPGMRYSQNYIGGGEAATWLQLAKNMYSGVVEQMVLDGVVTW
jgi:hypothetical protein